MFVSVSMRCKGYQWVMKTNTVCEYTSWDRAWILYLIARRDTHFSALRSRLWVSRMCTSCVFIPHASISTDYEYYCNMWWRVKLLSMSIAEHMTFVVLGCYTETHQTQSILLLQVLRHISYWRPLKCRRSRLQSAPLNQNTKCKILLVT